MVHLDNKALLNSHAFKITSTIREKVAPYFPIPAQVPYWLSSQLECCLVICFSRNAEGQLHWCLTLWVWHIYLRNVFRGKKRKWIEQDIFWQLLCPNGKRKRINPWNRKLWDVWKGDNEGQISLEKLLAIGWPFGVCDISLMVLWAALSICDSHCWHGAQTIVFIFNN